MALQRTGQRSAAFGTPKSDNVAVGTERVTWLKIRLGDESTPETWFELKNVDPNTGVHRFEHRTDKHRADRPPELIAYLNPKFPLIAIYKNSDAQNYFSRERNGRDRGVLCRLYCNKTKPQDGKESRLYLSGKYHPDGAMVFEDPTGDILPESMQRPVLRADASVVYGSIVGGRGLELMRELYDTALRANEQRKAYEQNLGNAAAATNALVQSIPGAAEAKKVGDALDFGF